MIVGWKEYVLLPGIQPAAIRAKLDTGALTSSLDARDIKTFWVGGAEHVEFRLAEPPPIPSNAAHLTPWTKSNFLAVNSKTKSPTNSLPPIYGSQQSLAA